ncbi:MAG: hypothetical protein V1676_07420 [Candidatus Diapherotrites archaeon]
MGFANKTLRIRKEGIDAAGKAAMHGSDEDMRQSGQNMLLYFSVAEEAPYTDANLKAIGDAVGTGAYPYCDVAIFSTVHSPAENDNRIRGIEVYMFDYYVPISGGGKALDGTALAAEKIRALLKQGAGIDARVETEKSVEFEGDYLDILPFAFRGKGDDAGVAPAHEALLFALLVAVAFIIAFWI